MFTVTEGNKSAKCKSGSFQFLRCVLRERFLVRDSTIIEKIWRTTIGKNKLDILTFPLPPKQL